MPKIFIIPKNFDVPHATAGSFPLLKSRKTQTKQTETYNSKENQKIIYVQDRRT